MEYIKEAVEQDLTVYLHTEFGIDALEASILARRGLTSAEDVKFFRESNARFLHNPFLFNEMENAVERVKQAIEEGEYILVYGDKDVDGLCAAALLANTLKRLGAKVTAKVPQGFSSYGLNAQIVEDFVNELKEKCGDEKFGALIITVDCGINCHEAIEKATSYGIDVIVTDHHNPPPVLPEALVIIDPQLESSGYPFRHICGAQVAQKLVEALRLSLTPLYGIDTCFMDVHLITVEGVPQVVIECLKSRNLNKTKSAVFIVKDKKSRDNALSHIADFMCGAQIYVWNEQKVKALLKEAFSQNVDFAMYDVKPIVTQTFKTFADKSLADLALISHFAQYESEKSLVSTLFNLYVTWLIKRLKDHGTEDLQLAAVACIADVMPMTGENRIYVRNLLTLINKGDYIPSLKVLAAVAGVCEVGKKVSERDIAWSLCPLMNSAGRMDRADLILDILTTKDEALRQKLALEVKDLNEERKRLTDTGLEYVYPMAKKSFDECKNILAVYAPSVRRGLTGLLAGRLMGSFGVSAIVMTDNVGGEEDTISGSMRAPAGFMTTDFLRAFESSEGGTSKDSKGAKSKLFFKKKDKKTNPTDKDGTTQKDGSTFFTDFGGHDGAAGFVFEKAKLDEFWIKLYNSAKSIKIDKTQKTAAIKIDAEIPPKLVDEKLLDIVDKFAPFGHGNEELIFLTRGLVVKNVELVGKDEKKHLRLLLSGPCVTVKAMFWGAAARAKEFTTDKKIDILYNVVRNTFNGVESMQFTLLDAQGE